MNTDITVIHNMVVVTTTSEPPATFMFGEGISWLIDNGILTVVGAGGRELGSWAPGHWSSVQLASQPTNPLAGVAARGAFA